MAAIRASSQIASKWASVTPGRSGEYEDGIKSPRRDWAKATGAANEAYKAGVTQAIGKDSFAKGVARAGTSAWQEGSLQKGVTRWGPGVSLAQEKYQRGFEPYRDAIERTTLPARGARGDPRNLQRVAVIVDALRKAKLAQG